MTDFSSLPHVILPGDDAFAAAVSGFNTAVVHAPDAVVAAQSTDDIVQAVRFARDNGLVVRTHNTGHGAVTPHVGGLLVGTRALDAVSVDAAARTATFGGGVQWGAVVAAAAEHGLAPIIGSASTVGAVGYLLGGGLGPLARSHGFSSDYLVSLQVVTGTGDLVTASADDNPELFWALRGGKGGLGVVVEATVRLIELDTLYGGALFFDIADGAAVLNGLVDWQRTADPRVTTSLMAIRFPDFEQVPPPLRGRHLVSVRFAFPGDTAEGERLAAPLRALAPVHLDTLGELPAGQIARVHNDPTEGGPGWGFGVALHDLDAGFTDAFLGSFGAGSELPLIAAELRFYSGGATAIDVPEGSAVGGRDVEALLHVIGVPDPSLFAEVLPGVQHGVEASLAAWIAPTTTINWVDDPTDPVAFAKAWPDETRLKLARVRATHDPDHVFVYGPA